MNETPFTCVPCQSREPLRKAERESNTGQGSITWQLHRCTRCGKVRSVESTVGKVR